MSVIEFLKMDKISRAEIVTSKGVLIDGYMDKDEGLQVYYYEGFFVEIVFTASDEIKDVMPFISGYKKEKYPILGNKN